MTSHEYYGGRPPEIEEPTNRWVVHPIGDAILPLLMRFNVHPNLVSFAGMAAGLMAAWFYFHWDDPWMATAGFAYMIAWHVLDGVDGKLARATGKTSKAGKYIDGACDNITFIAVYVVISIAISKHSGPWIWWYSGIAGAAHFVQAAAYERQRELYISWMRGAPFAPAPSPEPRSLAVRIFDVPFSALQRLFDGEPLPDDLATKLRELSDTDRQRALVAYREYHAPMIQSWSIMCANYRTIMIWLACVLGIPAAFFAFEIVVMNVILIALLVGQRRTAHEFNAWLRDMFMRERNDQNEGEGKIE